MATKRVYCAVADVQRWIKRVQFDIASKVTTQDVEFYIDMVSNVIDGELRALGVTLPINSEAKVSMDYLKMVVAFEAASMAEQAANFGANKAESTHGKYLHDKYIELLENMKSNPCVLSDVVTSSVRQMRSSTEDMLPGGAREGEEVFTPERITDFVFEEKIPTPSEKLPNVIDGRTDPTRV